MTWWAVMWFDFSFPACGERSWLCCWAARHLQLFIEALAVCSWLLHTPFHFTVAELLSDIMEPLYWDKRSNIDWRLLKLLRFRAFEKKLNDSYYWQINLHLLLTLWLLKSRSHDHRTLPFERELYVHNHLILASNESKHTGICCYFFSWIYEVDDVKGSSDVIIIISDGGRGKALNAHFDPDG